VSAYRIDRRSGQLTRLNQVSSGGPGPCHLAIERTGRCVVVANYGGGSVAAYPLKDDGSLGDAASFVQHQGKSLNPQRQEGPHAHGVTFDPAGKLVFIPDLGLDKIMIYRIDGATAKLTPNDPPSVALKPGSGPRHFVFHPDGRAAYAINELASTVTVFGYDAKRGALTAQQTISTLPDGYSGPSTTAEIEVHPRGKFLYASNRGYDSIAVFAVNRNGTLKLLDNVSTQGKTPRNFAIEPTGEWLWAANQGTDTLVLFRIDQKTGIPIAAGQVLELGAPVCVKYLALTHY
jgi:6-phosphogluconolactonase